MQLDAGKHSLKPERQVQVLPGVGQISPAMPEQSESEQQRPGAMQCPAVWHSRSPLVAHTQLPLIRSQAWPPKGQAIGG